MNVLNRLGKTSLLVFVLLGIVAIFLGNVISALLGLGQFGAAFSIPAIIVLLVFYLLLTKFGKRR